MSFLLIIWIILQISIGYNLVLPFLLWFAWRISGRKSLANANGAVIVAEADYAIIVTAYEQTQSLSAVVDSILKMDYLNYIVYIVADKCDVSNLQFTDPRVIVLRPPVVLGSNTASHRYAINNFIRDHERLTIIDSDNVLHTDYLNQLNLSFNKGFIAVQGLRMAKNTDTTIACLDSARDIFYHFYDGRVLFDLGSSATLAGSGMAFTKGYYQDFLKQHQVDGAGFDKVLQNYIVSRGDRIAFNELAIVYDEKSSKSEQLVNQRSRWINTWFKYFSYGFALVRKGVSSGSLNQFLFGMTLLRPPLFIFLLLSILFLLFNLWFAPLVSVLWILGMLLFVLSFFIALKSSDTPAIIYRSLSRIPTFMFHQVISLIKSRNANKASVATLHYHSDGILNAKKQE
ncbi:MAG: glycosyltransferase [Pedobacter sp.]